MSDHERVVHGDFHVIRMAGMFHVVFRPDSDPEWFRIIATFPTYERAWSYCDIERVSCFEVDTETGEEEAKGLCAPPVGILPGEGQHRELALLVRDIYDGDKVPAHQEEDHDRDPEEDEPPAAWRERIRMDAVAKQEKEAPKTAPFPASTDLSINQRSVLAFFIGNAGETMRISASYREIADVAKVSRSGIIGVIEALERKGAIEIIERGSPTTPGVFRLRSPDEADPVTDGPKCSSCGKPRHPGSVSQCRECYNNPNISKDPAR